MSSKRPTIRFSVDPDQKNEIDEYAKKRGYDNASNLARVALFAHMSRNRAGAHAKPRRSSAPHAESEIQ